MPSPLCHFEFMSNAPDKCRAFYTDVFGWEFSTSSMPDYTLIATGKEPAGGLMKKPPNVPGPCLAIYFQVDDIETALGEASAAGGQMLVPKTPIPGHGAFAFFTDPEGIPIGVFEAAK